MQLVASRQIVMQGISGGPGIPSCEKKVTV